MARTKLLQFMQRHAISSRSPAAATGLTSRAIDYIKLGEQSPRIDTAAKIRRACLELSGLRRVAITDLFDFGTDDARKAA